jgi:two-component system cell cycle sensor histidine kinase/response regulator CckA
MSGQCSGFRVLRVDAPEPMWIYDTSTVQFLEVNNAAVEHYGYSRDEFLRMRLRDIRQAADVPHLLERMGRLHEQELQKYGDAAAPPDDGPIADVEIIYHDLVFGGHEVRLMAVRDVTKQIQARAVRQLPGPRYRLIFEGTVVGIYQSTPDGRLLSAGPAMARMYGFDSSEEMMICITDRQAQLYVDTPSREEFKQLMEGPEAARPGEWQVYRKDGSKAWLWANTRATRRGKRAAPVAEPSENATDRVPLEEQLFRARQEYQDMLENAVVGICESRPDGNYTRVNPAMAKMLGYGSPQELLARLADSSLPFLVEFDAREKMERRARELGVIKDVECQAYRKDGRETWLSFNVRALFRDGVLAGYEWMIKDVSQQKELQEQLRQAQKMETIGRLAVGVAHDFNNALSVITGYSDLLQLDLPAAGPSYKHAVEIASAGRRAAGLTRQLLAFGRKQAIEPVLLDLNEATRELERMLRRLIGENIEILFKRSPDLGNVRMDPGQVGQVLMNLVINSRDAMPQGGRLLIETANVEFDEAAAQQNGGITSGPYVMLSVSDTGCGMIGETQLHIFEPFFTTKEPGKGTGLGLFTVYGIAKQNAGHIVAFSELGKGTTFRFYLPRIAAAVELVPVVQVLETIPRGTETVLVVEDEEALRLLTRTCLEGHNYTVLDAPNAAAALELADKHRESIHLLLTDVVLPGMSGHELASRIVALQPEAKVLFMSGYADDLLDPQRMMVPETALLDKPFTLCSLLSKVHKVLHVAQGASGAQGRIAAFCEFGVEN